MKKNLTKAIIAIALSAVFCAIASQVWRGNYKASSIIEIGTVGGDLIQDPQVIVSRIRSDAMLSLVCGNVGAKCKVDNLRRSMTVYQIGRGIYISCQHADPQLAVKACQSASSLVLSEHAERLQSYSVKLDKAFDRTGDYILVSSSRLLNEFEDSLTINKSNVHLLYLIIISVSFLLAYFKEVVALVRK